MAVSVARGARRSFDLLAPHVVLGASAGAELCFELIRVETGDAAWLIPQAVVAALALVQLWRRQDELRLLPVTAIALAFQLLLIWSHHTLGATGDQDVRSVYPVEGNELIHGHYPESEYPVGAVLLFGLESLFGGGEGPNRLLMVPFQLLCVVAVWGLRTRYSRWLAALVAIWPLNDYFWEYRFDLVPAALIAVGLLLAYRGRWGWSGVVLAVGAAVKWTPALSFAVLGVWLVAGRRWSEVRRHAVAFVVTFLLLDVPFLLWAPHNFLAAYRNQGSRAITNESLWYFPLDLLGLTSRPPNGEWHVWSNSGAPHWTNVAVEAVQAILLVGLAVLAVRARHRLRPAVALAALAPVVFLLTNRIFSPQFLVVLLVGWAFAAALVSRDRTDQLRLGLLFAVASFANAFVFPYAFPHLSWRPFSALLFATSLLATGLLVGRAATSVGPEEAVDRRLFPDAADEWRDGRRKLSNRPVPGPLPSWVARAVRWTPAALLAAFLVPTVFAASVLPYRFWDSLAYGSWSRVIAAGGFYRDAHDIYLHRPLFYVSQGLLWRVLGYHMTLGRLWSVVFGVAFVVFVWLLAGRLAEANDERVLFRALAVGGVLASSVFASFVAAGMADLPVAAAATATAVALWSPSLGRARVPLVTVGAAATLLAKPTGLLALAGLALATLAWNGRGELRRGAAGLLGIAAGAAGALVYDAFQAHRIGESLYPFLRAGNADYWTARGRAARWDATMRVEWLGAGLRLVVVFGLAYGLARVVGARTRVALAVAGPAAIVWSILGPVLADGGVSYPFDRVGPGLVGYALVAACLLAAPLVEAHDPFGRRVYAALLLSVAPGTLAWVAYRADEVRFLSPAWPGLILLGAAGLTVVALAVARLAPAAALLPVAGVAVLAFSNLVAIDGLGRQGWRDLLELGPSGWTDRPRTENLAYGNFSYELDLARENVGRGDRIVSNDGRLSFFFPTQVEVAYPATCAQLDGARYVALLLGGESADFARLAGSPSQPLAWLGCAQPRLQMVGEQPGIYASYVVGRPARPPQPADCRITSAPGQLSDGVFADGVGYGEARAVYEQAARAGFRDVRIERTGCSTFRVVNPGVPTAVANQADFRAEATSVGLPVRFAPAVRYPEVPPDVTPVR